MDRPRTFIDSNIFVYAQDDDEPAKRDTSSRALSHWDALIVKAAAASGCRVLLTEDLQHGQTIEGVTVHNPFTKADPG